MSKKHCLISAVLLTACSALAGAQTNMSVPVNNGIYYVLEQAQIKGLLSPLSGAKPYSQKQILAAIEEIYGRDSGKLSKTERNILDEAYKTFGPKEKGLDWGRGAYSFEFFTPKQGLRFAADIGVGAQIAAAGGFYAEKKEFVPGADNLITIYTDGDIGDQLSYEFRFIGHITQAERSKLGTYHTYYDGFNDDAPKGYIDREVTVYSQPRAFIPYTYRKYWDGFVVHTNNHITAEGLESWPDVFSVAPMFVGEISASILDDTVNLRFGRLRHEWASMAEGRSLVFNGAAQPFMAFETNFRPFYWFSFSSLTGVLEYFNNGDLKTDAWTFQNAFSIGMAEYNYKNYFHFDLGTAALWPKRFELGYLYPANSNFFYQDGIGDFDNMSFFGNIKGQYPGIGNLWFSVFVDEITPDSEILSQFFNLDRFMYALQAGTKVIIPGLPFTSLTFSYTKIEPYTYTHTRTFVPWYNSSYDGHDMPMETPYVNNGESLGYYLPPNSDEFLLRFETLPETHTKSFFQYQMIRHGADYGSHAVDGSSFRSELDPYDRNTKDVLKKFFLQDGAYQWQQIFSLGAEHTLSKLKVPVQLYGKFGFVYTFFTDVEGNANSGNAQPFSVIDTEQYPKSTGIFLNIGFRIYM
jgi:hypothetical protein